MKAKTLIEMLTDEQIVKILLSLGSGEPRRVSNALAFQTICHNLSGGSYKLYYYSHSKTFRCYTDCNESFDVIGLIKKVKECEADGAKRYICDLLNISQDFSYVRKEGFGDEGNGLIEEIEYLKQFIPLCESPNSEPPTLTRFNENVLRIYSDNHFYSGWLREGITINAMKKFEIKFDILNNRVIIPHRYADSTLVGVKTRYTNDDKLKYVPLAHNSIVYKYPTGLNLYGLYLNWANIKKIKKIIIFEGEKSVLKFESFYPNNNFSVALCGSNFTKEHLDLLLRLDGLEEVVIALDKEFSTSEEAVNYSNKISKVFINKLLNYFNVSVIWDTTNKLELKDSPIDKGQIVFEQLYNNRINIKE